MRCQFILLALLSMSPAMALAGERLDFYMEMQQREECQELGGRYDDNKCYLPNPGIQGPHAPIFVKNPSACPMNLLVAFVKPGDETYTVVGWWTIEQTFWSGIKLQYSDDSVVIHDGTWPLFFYAEQQDGTPGHRVKSERTFTFDGKSYGLTEARGGIIDGGYWIGAYC